MKWGMDTFWPNVLGPGNSNNLFDLVLLNKSCLSMLKIQLLVNFCFMSWFHVLEGPPLLSLLLPVQSLEKFELSRWDVKPWIDSTLPSLDILLIELDHIFCMLAFTKMMSRQTRYPSLCIPTPIQPNLPLLCWWVKELIQVVFRV